LNWTEEEPEKSPSKKREREEDGQEEEEGSSDGEGVDENWNSASVGVPSAMKDWEPSSRKKVKVEAQDTPNVDPEKDESPVQKDVTPVESTIGIKSVQIGGGSHFAWVKLPKKAGKKPEVEVAHASRSMSSSVTAPPLVMPEPTIATSPAPTVTHGMPQVNHSYLQPPQHITDVRYQRRSMQHMAAPSRTIAPATVASAPIVVAAPRAHPVKSNNRDTIVEETSYTKVKRLLTS